MDDRWHRIRAHRADGDYQTALRLARERLAALESDPRSRPHERREARELVSTLETILALAASARAELAEVDALTPLIESHCERQRFSEVPAIAERQLAVRERWLGRSHPDVLTSLDYLSNAYLDMGRFDEAEIAARRTLDARLATLDPDDPGIAESRANLGMILRDWGLHAEAIDHFVAASRIWRAAYGDHPQTVLALRNLGSCLALAGRYAESTAPMLGALAMSRRLHGQSHLSASVLVHLAGTASTLRDWGRGREWAEEAFRVLDERPDQLPNAYLRVMTTLGICTGALGDREASHAWYERALSFARANYPDSSPHVTACLSSRSAALAGLGDPSALVWAREAFERNLEMYGPDHPSMEHAHYVLARAHWCGGDLSRAEAHLRKALELGDRRASPPDRNAIDLADVLAAQDRVDEATDVLSAYVPRFELRRRMIASGVMRAVTAQEPYSRLAALALRKGGARSRARARTAWDDAERAVGRVAADHLLGGRIPVVPEHARERDRALRLRHRRLETQHAALLESPDREDPAVREQLRTLRNELLEVMSDRAETTGSTALGLSIDRPFPLERVQASLGPHEAVLGWLEVRPRHQPPEVWSYVIRRRGDVDWRRIPCDGSGTRSPLRAAIEDEAGMALGPPDSTTTPIARSWWAERLEPLGDALDGVRSIVIVGSGAMSFAPIDALVDADGTALVDRLASAYTPSATVHTHLRETARTGRAPSERPALLVADPPFGPAPDSAAEPDGDPELLARGPDPRLRSSLPRLAASADEIALIAPSFPRREMLVGPAATERALVELAERDALRTFGVLHFATHAIVDETFPERSVLVLAQHDLDDPLEAVLSGRRAHRGVVTVDEISRDWKLDADLVTLGACRTGVGPEIAGEGLISFAHAFLEAGARSVLVSLWRVDDRATALLMTRFYEIWLGRAPDHDGAPGKAEALRRAKRWLRERRDSEGHQRFAHPYYWAPFILIGDPD